MCSKPFSSTRRNAYHEICQHTAESCPHHDGRFCRLCRKVTWPTMEVACFKQQEIGQVVVCVNAWNIIWSVEGYLPLYEYTQTQLHAASYSCCFRSYRRPSNVHPGWYIWWLLWQHRGGLTGIWVVAVCHAVTDWMKRLSIGLLRIHLHLLELFVYPRSGGVE